MKAAPGPLRLARATDPDCRAPGSPRRASDASTIPTQSIRWNWLVTVFSHISEAPGGISTSAKARARKSGLRNQGNPAHGEQRRRQELDEQRRRGGQDRRGLEARQPGGEQRRGVGHDRDVADVRRGQRVEPVVTPGIGEVDLLLLPPRIARRSRRRASSRPRAARRKASGPMQPRVVSGTSPQRMAACAPAGSSRQALRPFVECGAPGPDRHPRPGAGARHLPPRER